MTRDCKTMKNTVGRLLFVGLVATVAVGCSSSGPEPKVEGYDYRQTHKVQVKREQVSVSIVLPAQGMELSPGDQRRFHMFIRDFVQRGRSAVTVESTQVQQALGILLANGLREGEINIAPDTTVAAPNAVLSFTANTTVAPECGDWSADALESNPSNKPSKNFGCAVQRNIGQTVADPGDLIQAQPGTGGAASRTDEAIRAHQSGAPKTRLIDRNASVVAQ